MRAAIVVVVLIEPRAADEPRAGTESGAAAASTLTSTSASLLQKECFDWSAAHFLSSLCNSREREREREKRSCVCLLSPTGRALARSLARSPQTDFARRLARHFCEAEAWQASAFESLKLSNQSFGGRLLRVRCARAQNGKADPDSNLAARRKSLAFNAPLARDPLAKSAGTCT